MSIPPPSADERIEAPPAARKAKPGSRAGRPTAARVEAINSAILQAAREHFLAAGFEATPMEAVAASAGISKGTLYARYATKEALLRAVVEEQLAAWKAHEARRQGPLPAEFKARLQHHARAILDALGSERMRAFETLIGGAGRPATELVRALHESGYRMAVDALAEEIAAGAGQAPAPPANPTAVAETLMAMLYGWYSANEQIRRVTRDEARAFADLAVELLLNGRAAW